MPIRALGAANVSLGHSDFVSLIHSDVIITRLCKIYIAIRVGFTYAIQGPNCKWFGISAAGDVL